MSLNASKRNMQRSTRIMDKSLHNKSISNNKTLTDNCAGNKNSVTQTLHRKNPGMPPPGGVTKQGNKTLQDKCAGTQNLVTQTLHQKNPGMPPPGGVTKQVKNPIPIRHTLTSKLRMEKANPLLTSSLPSEPAITGTPSRRSTFYPGMLQPKQKLEFRSNVPASERRPALRKTAANNANKNLGSVFKENKPPLPHKANVKMGTMVSKPSRISVVNKTLPTSLSKKDISSSIQNRSSAAAPNKTVHQSTWNRSIPFAATNVTSTKQMTNTSVKTKRLNDPKRNAVNSKQAEKGKVLVNIQKSQTKKLKTPVQKQLKSILRKSASVGDLRKAPVKNDDTDILSEIEKGPERKVLNKSLKSVAFYSPLNSSAFTPINITNTPTPSVLRKRLEDWLAKRGKSSFSYRHLCCFGLPKNASIGPSKISLSRKIGFNDIEACTRDDQKDTEPRLNETITLEPSDCQLSHSFENAHGIENAPKGSSTPEHETDRWEENKENDVYLSHPEALNDLRKLVHSGYPRDQCEHWLSVISKTHPTVKEIPQYWECLAALEEARGDFSSAVDCYGRAIVKGADADDVDEHLDELWEKFCTLSVNSVENKKTPTKKLAIDTKQIFKSTVIKFALQQKAVKRSSRLTEVSMQNVNYIVTPVRRSSRKSTSRFKTSVHTTCVDKLEDLEQTVRETMEFHGNAVLTPGK